MKKKILLLYTWTQTKTRQAFFLSFPKNLPETVRKYWNPRWVENLVCKISWLLFKRGVCVDDWNWRRVEGKGRWQNINCTVCTTANKLKWFSVCCRKSNWVHSGPTNVQLNARSCQWETHQGPNLHPYLTISHYNFLVQRSYYYSERPQCLGQRKTWHDLQTSDGGWLRFCTYKALWWNDGRNSTSHQAKKICKNNIGGWRNRIEWSLWCRCCRVDHVCNKRKSN